jgi:hypothetical protein
MPVVAIAVPSPAWRDCLRRRRHVPGGAGTSVSAKFLGRCRCQLEHPLRRAQRGPSATPRAEQSQEPEGRGDTPREAFATTPTAPEPQGRLPVMLTRLLPVVMETMRLVGRPVHHVARAFLAASLAGTAPIVVIYAYAGAVSRQVDSIVPAVVILVAVAACGYASYRAKCAATDTPAGARTDARGLPNSRRGGACVQFGRSAPGSL